MTVLSNKANVSKSSVCMELCDKATDSDFEVSFVVPCYNVEKYIARCLDSILVQRGASFEIICVDDGSTDGTPAILAEYSSANDSIRVVTKQNSGLADTRNVGVLEARGDYVIFVDSDDFIAPSYLDEFWDAHVHTGADLVVTDGVPVVASSVGRLFEKWKSASCCKARIISKSRIGAMLLSEQLSCSAWGKLIKRDVCLKYPFQSGRFHEDVEVIASYYLSSSCCVKIDLPLYGYFMRSGSITHAASPSAKQLGDFIEAYASMEKMVSNSFGCSNEAKAHHRMIMACRYHSMITKSSADAVAKSKESELISNAIEAIKSASAKKLAKGTYLRFKLLTFSPPIYDAALFIYERCIKGRFVQSLDQITIERQ